MSHIKEYNYNLDFVKGIACICVVFMHCEFPGTLGVVIQTISRFCVPFFFMVSGYFSYQTASIYKANTNNSRFRKIYHILKIITNASLFYLLFVVVQSQLFNNIDWHIGFKQLFYFLILNEPFIIARQYWFLFALLYVYIMYAIIDKYRLYQFSYALAVCLFISYIILAQGMHILGIFIPNAIYKNFLIEGFAYFMLGHWIHNKQSILQLKNSTLYFVIAISTILCLIERYLLGRDFGVNIVSIPQVFCLFLYAVKNPHKNQGVLQEIGKRYSMYVYIFHPFVWHSLEYIYAHYHIQSNSLALYAMPILVLIISLLLSHIVYICNNRFFNYKKINYA